MPLDGTSISSQVREIAKLLAATPNAKAFAASIGEIKQDRPGGEILVRPRARVFESALVTRQHQSDLVAGVELRLASAADVSVLSGLGTFSEGVRVSWNSPRVLDADRPLVDDATVQVVVYAQVDDEHADHVLSISLRRDAK